MSILKKINRGVVLTVLVVAAVVIYLVLTAFAQAGEKPEIKKVCNAYLKKVVTYRMLPSTYRTGTPSVSNAELDKYFQKMTDDFKSLYINNEYAYKTTLENYKDSLKNQAKGSNVVVDYKKTVTKYDSFEFDKNNVTVKIKTYTTRDFIPGGMNTGKVSKSGTLTDTITLQKSGDTWKVLNADITEMPLDNGTDIPNGAKYKVS